MNENNIVKLRGLVIEQLTHLINGDYVLLDIPNHSNIGDNLIWEGELIYLREHVKFTNKYSANVVNLDINKIQNNIILFHGGGNFGDLYRECQELRINVAKDYPNNRIIIFPQTVFYQDKSKLVTDCEILNAHNDIYICVRDQESYDTLSRYISKDKLLMLPDMAFFMDIKPETKKTGKALLMQRTDNEKKDISAVFDKIYKEYQPSDLDIKDWPTYSNNKYVRLTVQRLFSYKLRTSRILQRIPILTKLVDPCYGLNNRNNRARYIDMGVDFLEQYDTIYTTRLHGLILAILLNKRVVIIDNSHGKCLRFHDTWLRCFANITVLDKE